MRRAEGLKLCRFEPYSQSGTLALRLPELWNVAKGDMSLVGPRPEVQQYVDMNDPLWKQVLAVGRKMKHVEGVLPCSP